MFETVDWTDVDDVGNTLRREFVTAIRKADGFRAVVQEQQWQAMIRDGTSSGKKINQFWRSCSPTLSFDVPQMLSDEVGLVTLNREMLKQVKRISEHAIEVLKDNEDVFAHPNFFVEKKAFLITFFWYVEFASFA